MTTEREALAFWELSRKRALERFFPTPAPMTGFGDLPMDYATQPGREVLVQTKDFEETK